MLETIYIYSKVKDQELSNYLKELPDMEAFSFENNIYKITINSVYHEEYQEIFEALKSDIFEDINIFYSENSFGKEIDSLLLNHFIKMKEGSYVLGDILFSSILNNDVNLKVEFKKLILNTLPNEIINTALVFIECGNVVEAAKKLYIHRNTLTYRLDLIKKKTSLDLKRFKDSFSFYALLS